LELYIFRVCVDEGLLGVCDNEILFLIIFIFNSYILLILKWDRDPIVLF